MAKRAALAKARRSAGYTQEELALRLSVAPSTVARWEAGEHQPQPYRWPLLARLLGLSRAELAALFTDPNTSGQHSGTHASPTEATYDGEGDEVRRRQFGQAVALALGTSAFGWFNPSSAAGTPPETKAANMAIVRKMISTFREIDNRHGGGHARSAVHSYLTHEIAPLLGESRLREGVRQDLFTAVAELNQLAGWIAYDIGDTDSGHRHLHQALWLCQEAGDKALAAEMLAGMSHHATFHRTPTIAVDQARAARANAARTGLTALQAETAVMEAHGLAQLGDTPGCLAALADAERAFAKADHEQRPDWLKYFDDAYLAAKFAHTFRELGRPVEAERYARRSLEMSEGYDRGKLFNTALLASILADQRRIEEACATGAEAVAMTPMISSVRTLAYLADVGQRLAPYRSEPAVITLYALMKRSGIPVPA
ncbi:hypothetical protein GCM10012275_15200 [Longimycelium tulufanense]|uniref:HTH cro/C1-type domain-containing protein n=1 Tax=Longimycelium tulufanense TaxID=907463 RepID=A0A8J3C6Y0_9PSEU|nr:helix-turn-helix transcriptional regulator [Longimycelium tulufanense]GGM45099.1 hypothetical protein GCM10012275_15200 [Longimycelium tulufanense]